MNSSLSRCPIEDILPWMSQTLKPTEQPESSSFTLITDRVETSGRFLLYVTAAGAFRSQQPVLWLSFNGVYTTDLIRQGLKKIGCTLARNDSVSAIHENAKEGSSPSIFVDSTGKVSIRSVAQEFADLTLKDTNELKLKDFVLSIYCDVRKWIDKYASEGQACLILLDDISALADLVGRKLAFAFCYQMRSLIENGNLTLLVRCVGDAMDSSLFVVENEWIGNGGADFVKNPISHPWETSLVELADWVVDVLPLQSGYTREAHGRLLLTPLTTLGGRSPARYNYCLTDHAVFAIRLTSKKQG